MKEPIGGRAEHLGAWAEAWSWCGAGPWWPVPTRSEAAAAGGGRQPRRRLLHERAPLSPQEERRLSDLEAALDGSPHGVRGAPWRGSQLLLVVLVLLLAVVLPIQAEAALGLAVLTTAVAAGAWTSGGAPGSDGVGGQA